MQSFEQNSDAKNFGRSPPPRGDEETAEHLRRRVARLEHKLAESERRATNLLAELAASARKVNEAKLLVREVDHRAKNSLQIAASMLRLQASYADDARVKAALGSAMQRLQNLAAIHAALYQSDDSETVPVRAWLERICYAFEIVGEIALSVEAPSVCWPAPAVRAMGLFTGEAVANALKHGFPDGRAGWLSVSLAAGEGEGFWRLEIADDGEGRVDDMKEGLGLKLLHIFARELGGWFEVTTGLGGRGLAVAVVFPSPCEEGRTLL